MSTGGQLGLDDQSVTSRKVDLVVQSAYVGTSETTTSISFVDLPTVGPTITITTGVTQDHICSSNAQITANAVTGRYVGINLNGTGVPSGQYYSYAHLAAGSYTPGVCLVHGAAMPSGALHKLQYRVDSNTGTFAARSIIGWAA